MVWDDGYEDGLLWEGLLVDGVSELTWHQSVAHAVDAAGGHLLMHQLESPFDEGPDDVRWCVGFGESVGDLACDRRSFLDCVHGRADQLVLTYGGHEAGRFDGLCDALTESYLESTTCRAEHGVEVPRITLPEWMLRESDEWEGYYLSETIAYRGCLLQGHVWRSGNEGLWKDSWAVSYPRDHELVERFTFWDDLGLAPAASRPLGEAMGLLSGGLSKAMHYVNLDPEGIRYQRWQER